MLGLSVFGFATIPQGTKVEPKLRKTGNDNSALTISAFVTTRVHDDKPEGFYVDVEFIGKVAENMVQVLGPGAKFVIRNGSLDLTAYEDRYGNKRINRRIRVYSNSDISVTRYPAREEPEAGAPAPEAPVAEAAAANAAYNAEDDEIPF